MTKKVSAQVAPAEDKTFQIRQKQQELSARLSAINDWLLVSDWSQFIELDMRKGAQVNWIMGHDDKGYQSVRAEVSVLVGEQLHLLIGEALARIKLRANAAMEADRDVGLGRAA